MAVDIGGSVGVGSSFTTAGGGRVTVGITGGGSVGVMAGTAVPTAANIVGETASVGLIGLELSSPPQATRAMATMSKMIS